MGNMQNHAAHGRFTPASAVSRALKAAGFAKYLVRNNEAYGGYVCSWEKNREVTRVSYRQADDTPEDQWATEKRSMVAQYKEALETAGYTVSAEGGALYVPPKGTAPNNPEEPTKVKIPGRKPNVAATNHVIRNLFKESEHMHMDGTRFDLHSLDNYREQACAWLGDKSELSTGTLERADWLEVLNTFRNLEDLPLYEESPSEPASDKGKPVHHVVTGKLVGWLRDGKFIDAE